MKTNDQNILNGFATNNISLDNLENSTVDLVISQTCLEMGGKILEFGCGSGRLASVFIARDYDYYGLEKSQGLCKKFREIIGSNVKNINGYQTGLDSDSFDVCLIWSVVQYLPNIDYLANVLIELLRVGTVIFLGDLETVDNYADDNNLRHLVVTKKWLTDFCRESNVTLRVYEKGGPCTSRPSRYHALLKRK